MNRKLVLNALSGTMLYVVNVIVAFVMSPVYLKALGNRDYGLWELIMSVIGYMGLLDFGIGSALVRFVSVADGRCDQNDLQKTISTALIFFIAVGSVAVLIFCILGYETQLIAGKEVTDIANLSTIFILLGINAGFLFPLQVFTATLLGVQKHYFINFIRVVLLIISAAIIYNLLQKYQGHGLLILALITPIFTAIQFVLFAGAVFCDRNIPNFTLSAVTSSKAKEMLSFGTKSATMLIASRIQSQSVPLIIGNVLGLGQIVYFVMPNRLIDYAKGISQSIGFPLVPYLGAVIGKGDRDELVRSWLDTTLALQIVSLAMPLVIFFCGESFLGLWLGQEYAVAGSMVLYILLFGLVADSLSTNAFRILTAKDKHGSNAVIWLVLSALSIPVGVACAYLWGIAGVAAGTTVVSVLGNFITLFMACKIMQVSFRTYINNTIIRLLFPLSLLAATLKGLSGLYPLINYRDLLLHLAVSCFVYVLAVWLFTLGKGVRGKIKHQMKNYLMIRKTR